MEDLKTKIIVSQRKTRYSDAVKSKKKKFSVQTQIMRQTSLLTRQKWEETVNSCTLGVSVSKLKTLDKIAIKCNIHIQNIQKQIGNDY